MTEKKGDATYKNARTYIKVAMDNLKKADTLTKAKSVDNIRAIVDNIDYAIVQATQAKKDLIQLKKIS